MKKHINEVADFETRQPGIVGIIAVIANDKIILAKGDETRITLKVPCCSDIVGEFEEGNMVGVYGLIQCPQAIVNYATNMAYFKDP
tara:strand:- start:1712 stop:1969 length:258 start_codon:yes stop_codon:yes gene_type:complete